MKRLTIILLAAVVLFTLTACNGNGASSGNSDTTSKLTEKDIFEYNGTESEYNITESEAKELFEKQPTVSSEDESSQKESSESDTESQSDTSSQNGTSSQSDTPSQNDASSTEDVTTDNSSSTTTSTNEFDKDGDGWTDGWQ